MSVSRCGKKRFPLLGERERVRAIHLFNELIRLREAQPPRPPQFFLVIVSSASYPLGVSFTANPV
jgi:hypothetical protein